MYAKKLKYTFFAAIFLFFRQFILKNNQIIEKATKSSDNVGAFA
jgi:hypothetical protein